MLAKAWKRGVFAAAMVVVAATGAASCLDSGEEDGSGDKDYTAANACQSLLAVCGTVLFGGSQATCESELAAVDPCVLQCAVEEKTCDRATQCVQGGAARSDHCGSAQTDGDFYADGDYWVDGDVPADGDAPSCSGACDVMTDVSFCVAVNVCLCEAGSWNFYNCAQVCQRLGQQTRGCGPNDAYAFDYCVCGEVEPDGDASDGDVPDGDVPDGDVSDGDVPDGDVPDGDDDLDVPDGDVPDGDLDQDREPDRELEREEEATSCSGSCSGTPLTFCIDGPDLALCYCDGGYWSPYDCNEECVNAGYDGAEDCRYDAEAGYDLCMCGDNADGDLDVDADPDREPEIDNVDQTCSGYCSGDVVAFCYEAVSYVALCWCSDNAWTILDCNAECQEAGYAGADTCGYEASYGYDVCFCYQ